MTAMIGTPMTFFSHGELEQITVGWFPIFLIAWLRWVDRPTGRGLAAAVGPLRPGGDERPVFRGLRRLPGRALRRLAGDRRGAGGDRSRG